MEFTKKFLRAKSPCADGFRWFSRHVEDGSGYQQVLDTLVDAGRVGDACWLLSQFVFKEQLAPVAQAVQQLANPPAVQVQPDIAPQSPLFQQYEENLRKNEQQARLDQARSSSRNQSNPKCQFWLQQDQTAPSEKSRANVLQFCD